MSNRSPSWLPATAMATAAAAWGTIPLIVRSVPLPDLQLAATRVTLGALVLAPITVRTLRRRSHDGFGGRLLLMGALLAVHWSSFFVAISRTSVAAALVLIYLAPVAMAALSGPVLGEQVGRVVKVALGVSVFGLWLVIRGELSASAGGIVAGVISASTLAAFTIIGRPIAQRLGGLATASMQLTVAAVLLLPWTVAAIATVPWEPAATPQVWGVWWQALVLGVLLTGATIAVNWWVLSQIPVATTSVFYYLEPASAIVLAAIVLGERPDALAWIGVTLVLVAGAMAAVASRTAPTSVH